MARPREIVCPNCGEKVPDAAGNGWWTLRSSMPDETQALWDETAAAVRAEMRREGIHLHASPRIANGQILEVLCASYLAGARDHERGLREAREREHGV